MPRWLLAIALFAPLALALDAEPVTVESPHLALTVSGDGALVVRRKASGRVWRTALAARPPQLVIPQAVRPPVIDGEPGDWPATAGPVLDSTLLADARQVDGDADCSARTRLAWTTEGLYLLVEVIDQQITVPAEPDLHWWEHDSVELWINGSQFGLALSPQGALVSRLDSREETAQVVARLALPGGRPGYRVEAFIPWAAVAGEPPAPVVGSQFRLAIGVNDADGADREGQLYWPATWRHGQTETFAQALLADPEGRLPGQPAPAAPLLSDLRREGNQIRYTQPLSGPDGATWPAEVTLTVPADADEVAIRFSLPDPTVPFGDVAWPEPLGARLERGQVFFANYGNGLLLPQDDPRYQNRTLWGASIDLPFCGLVDDAAGDGYLLVLDTPYDGGIKLSSVTGPEGERQMVPQAIWRPQLGSFGQPRALRLVFSDAGGYVALAKRYRAIAAQQQVLKTLRQKLVERPAIARLAGAPDFWGAGLSWARDAANYGIDRGIINITSTRAQHEEVERMGYLTSRYDNYVDLLLEPDPAKWSNVNGPAEQINVRPDGEPDLGWLTWDKQRQYYKRSSTFMRAQAEIDIPKDLANRPYLGRFLDVTTASGLVENWSPEHRSTREDDMRHRNALFAYVNEQGLVTGGEHGRWWAVPYMDYLEGMMSGAHFSWPAGHLRQPETGLAGISQEYRDYGLGGARRIPLWELIFGDCTVDYWYWGDTNGYLDSLDPSLSDRKDAFNVLYGTPPMYWTGPERGFGWRTPEGRQRLLQSYFHTAPWHQAVMLEEMQNHETLTADRLVQRTTFSGGYQAVVNLADEARTVTLDDREVTLPPNGFIARGPQFLLERLEVNGRLTTRLRTPELAYVDGNGTTVSVPGILSQGRCLVRVESPSELFISQGSEGVINPPALVPDWDTAGQRVFSYDERGQLIQAVWRADERLEAWGGARRGPVRIRTGPHTRPADLAIAALRLDPPTPRQGEPATLTVEVWNEGLTAAPGARLTVELEGQTLHEQTLDLGAGRGPAVDPALPAHQTVSCTVPTADLDGPRRLRARVAMPEGVAEPLLDDNQRELAVAVVPDRQRWPAAPLLTLTVEPASGAPVDTIAEAPLTVPADRAVASLRVWEPATATMLPAQFEPATPGARTGVIVFQLPGPLTGPRAVEILAAPADSTLRIPGGGGWQPATQTVTMPGYRFSLTDGTISELANRLGAEPARPIINHLIYSSQETGWNEEPGTVESLTLAQAGPVRTVLRVRKALKDRVAVIDRTIRCYDTWFEVETRAEPSVTGLHSRLFYLRGGAYSDSRGKTTVIDGRGDDDGKVSGAAPDWIAVRGNGWAHSYTSLLPGGGLSFWDSSGWGGLGYVGPATENRVALVFHPAMDDDTFAAADAARLRATVKVTPTSP